MVCPFLTAKEHWRDALDYKLVSELLLEDGKIADCVMSAGLMLSLEFCLHIFAANVCSWLRLCIGFPRPTIPRGFVTVHSWYEAFVFTEVHFHQKNRIVSVSTGTLPPATVIVVAVRQNPQGGGVLALVENATDLSISHHRVSSVFWYSMES